MRILLIQESYLPHIGGAEFHVYQLAKELIALGYEVKIITGSGTISGADNGEICTVIRHRIIKGRMFTFPLWLYRLLNYARDTDVIHVHFSSFLAFVSCIAGSLLGKRVVMTLHGYGTLDSSVNNSILKKMYRYVSMKFSTHIIATSQEMKDIALRYTSNDKITIITNGVDTDAFRPERERTFHDLNSKMQITTLRRLVPKNGVHFVVDALYRADNKLNYHLDIIGDGPLLKKIQDKIENYGLKDCISLLGPLYHKDVITQLQSSDIVMFLSTAESTSLAALECMAAGIIVVSSNAGAFPDFIQDGVNGFIINLFRDGQSDYNAPANLEEWQYHKIIEKLIEIQNMSPDELKSIAQTARNLTIKNYDWKIITAKTVSECYVPR